MESAVWILLSLLIGLLSLAIGLLVGNYLPSYIRKKAENLATKEDIGAITEKIEKVRARLELVTDQRAKLEEARRDTLTCFFEVCVELVNERLPINLGDIPERGGDSPKVGEAVWRHIEETERLFSAMTVAGHKLALYFESEHPLRRAAIQLLGAVGHVRPVFKNYFAEFQSAWILLFDENLRAATAKVARNVTDDPTAYLKKLRDIQGRFGGQLDNARSDIIEAYRSYVTEFNKYVGAEVIPSDEIA